MSMREPITSLEDPVDEIERAPHETRLLVFKVVLLVAFALLAGQLWRLQVVEGEQHRQHADNNRFRQVPLPPTRGVIYDRSGILLVRNMPSYTISIVPADLPKEAEAVYGRLGRLLRKDPTSIREAVEPAPRGKRATNAFTPVVLAENVDEQTAFIVMERHLDLPGVHVEVQPIREYLDGPLTAHILGFVRKISAEQYEKAKGDPVHRYGINDQMGQMGIELMFETDLRGFPGQKRMEVNASGREVTVLGVDPPEPGHNLRLTIDLALQQRASEVLQADLERFRSASVVAIDPRNGQVLAMVHLPSYDNNLFTRGISLQEYERLMEDPRRPMVNGAIASAYAPGAAFMPITASAALAEQVIAPENKLECTGKLVVPNPYDSAMKAEYPCWKEHGPQDVISALADSCAVYFYQLGVGAANGEWEGLGSDRLGAYARYFGLGQATGIDLPGEASGVVPSAEWKRETYKEEWYPGDTYAMSIGLGALSATPLQMANAAVALANGGILYRPQLVLEVLDAEGNVLRPYMPQVIREIPLDARSLESVRQGMQAAMLSGETPYGTRYVGTSSTHSLEGITVAGKAGTAEHGPPDDTGRLPTHGWFIAYAPADDPRIALAVLVENGRGPDDAAKAGMEILSAYLGARLQENGRVGDSGSGLFLNRRAE